MKTTRLLFIGVAVMLLSTSCVQILDSLAKNPVFEFSGLTVYDGQKAFLGTTATCKIGWTNHNPEIVTLQHNEQGKECIATFKLPDNAKKVTTVALTATNLDDMSVDPYNGEITVAPWKIAVYKKDGSGEWKQIETTTIGNSSTFSYSASGNGSGTYKLQLEYLDKTNTYKAISSIPYRLAKMELFKVKWGGLLIGIDGNAEKDDCSQEFVLTTAPAPAQSRATAYIGEVGHTVQVLP